MNIILLESGECAENGIVQLRDRRARHILQVLKAQPGEQVRVGLINGPAGLAEITATGNDYVQLHAQFDQSPPNKLPLTIVLALPRPKMLRRILRTAAELGIARLWLINTWKVEKSYWQSPLLAPEQIRGYLLEGLEQARDTVLPVVECRRLFKPFVEDELADIVGSSRGLVAHPGSAIVCPSDLQETVTLAIGPEGGFTPYEVEQLQRHGFQAVDFGQRILRVETALTALTSRLFAPL